MNPANSQQTHLVRTPIVTYEGEHACPITGCSETCTPDTSQPTVFEFPATISVKNTLCIGDVIYTCGKCADGTFVHTQAFIFESAAVESEDVALTPQEQVDVQEQISSALKIYISENYECTPL